jgi:basic membrane protein A
MALLLSLCACQQEEEPALVAVISDGGSLTDEGYNQALTQGAEAWCEANECEYRCYQPTGATTEAYQAAMELAYEDGADVIIVAGSAFEEAVYQQQTAHKYLPILLLDGEPHDIDYNYATETTVHCVTFQEEEAGFLAGYAAVMEGYRKLGFLGGVRLKGVIQYGYGFLQGADRAAQDLGLEEGGIQLRLEYTNTFEADSETEQLSRRWYNSGTQVIFAACGAGSLSVVEQAQQGAKRVILSDFAQSDGAAVTLITAEKKLEQAIALSLDALKDNDWSWSSELAGQTQEVGVAEGCVALTGMEEAWPLTTFTQEAYQQLVEEIAAGRLTISNEISAMPATSYVTVLQEE